MWTWITLAAVAVALNFSAVSSAGAGAARLVCYVDGARADDSFSECTHLVYAGNAREDKLDAILKEYKKTSPRIKIVLRVAETDKDLRALLKSKHVQGLEVHDAHHALNRTKVHEKIQAARSAISSTGSGPLFLSLPAHPELLAKYYDLRVLVKLVDLLLVETDTLGLVTKMTYHPSRLSGLWDMMNTDSVVDLVVGLGVPASKVVISLPATARQFTLVNETLSTPGSPTEEEDPKEIDQTELCRLLQEGRWTLERDQDLSAPYAFRNKTWISFEDSSSVDVKGKYARVRGLAGLALKKADKDLKTPCGPTLKTALSKVLNQQSRAPRALVLRSLEQEILSAPSHARALDALQVSPYRITQVVDADGVIHSIREDTRTEFSCSRQGYFVHPRSCARFYRCVKFDQLSPDYTVFEFDCPAGLAFDNRYEVCVWPGSLPHSQACPGSSEIAPVPQTRFVCPAHEGYYADPENCRWFFACLDHGKAPLTAYEFRCPFGLGFDAEKLKCDWPWLVPACGNIARYEAEAFGYSGASLTGAAGFHGQTADAVNVAAHQSLVSGASLDNLVGIQGGYLSQKDALDGNFIASQELANGVGLKAGQTYQVSHSNGAAGLSSHGTNGVAYQTVQTGNVGLVQPTQYSDGGKYTSGSLILDDYRLPTNKGSSGYAPQVGVIGSQYNKGYNGAQAYSSSLSSNNYNQKSLQYQASAGSHSNGDDSGAYVHDPTGDVAVPYRHVDAPAVPYVHDGSVYRQSNDYQDYNQGSYEGKYVQGTNSQYSHDNSGDYQESGQDNRAYTSDYSGAAGGSYNTDYSGAYNADYSGSYADDLGKYAAGVYQNGGQNLYQSLNSGVSGISRGKGVSSVNIQQYHGSYGGANSGNYVTDSKAYTGASHTLAAGSVNVGLVGKTTLVDAGYYDQGNYQNVGQNAYSTSSRGQSYSSGHNVIHQATFGGQLGDLSQQSVSINHIGTDAGNLDGYGYVTTPTTSGIPTTATPFASTTAIPAVTTTYKTTFVPEAPKSSINQIFGYSQPAVTPVQPTVIPVQQYVTPRIEVTGYNQAVDYQSYENKASSKVDSYYSGIAVAQSESSGYDYSKPSIKFEDGITYTTAAPNIQVSTFKPQGFIQQTVHKDESGGFRYSTPTPALAVEEPFKKVIAYTTGPPTVTYAQPTVLTYTPQSFSQQNIHKESTKLDTGFNGYEYTKSDIAFEQPKAVVQYTTSQPTITVQPVVSTYQPEIFNQHTIHNVDVSQVNLQSLDTSSGYHYPKPAVKFEEAEKTLVEVSTAQPAIPVSTYKPQSYSQQTIHKIESQSYVPVSSTSPPKVEFQYQQPPITVYQNPILKYTQKVTPVIYAQPTGAVYTQQSYQPIVHQHEVKHEISQPVQYETAHEQSYHTQNIQLTYNQPEIQRETYGNGAAYSLASDVSHQVINHNVKSDQKAGKDVVLVSSTPATLAYEDHYVEHEQPKKVETYQAPEYIPPKNDYQQTYSVSTVAPPTVQTVQTYQAPEYVPPKTVYQETYTLSTAATPVVQRVQTYQAPEYIPPKNIDEQFYTVSTVSPPIVQNVQSYHASEYKPPKNDYQKSYAVSTTSAPLVQKVQVYQAPEYVPPKIVYEESFVATKPVVHQQQYSSSVQHNQNQYDYSQEDYSQQYEFSQKTEPVQEFSFSTSHAEQPKTVESFHVSSFPGTTITVKPDTYERSDIQGGYKAAEYLPPVENTYLPPSSTSRPVVTSTYAPRTYATTPQKYLPPTPEPKYNAPEYLPPVETTFLPPSTTARPLYKLSTPSTTTYKYVESTSFKAPEYLPPQEESGSIDVSFDSFGLKNVDASKVRLNPYQKYSESKVNIPVVTSSIAPVTRKQNLVVETAKANLLGYGTIGTDAGLVSSTSYTTSAPIVVSSTDSYSLTPKTVTSTYSPVKQELVEINPRPVVPVRRTKPQVAVVTKINDFNPLLVRKLGAVCSCQSPVLVLKGRRPDVQIQQDYDVEYNDYDETGRGDVNGEDFAQTSERVNIPSRIKAVTIAPSVTSTFNPIIVPDDSYYQDISGPSAYNVDITPKSKESYSDSYVSSTPAVYSSTTEKVYTIRPRVKAVTVAPTYRTVLLNEVTPTPAAVVNDDGENHASAIESQSFDRYGPGGWRSRDETLQGSVDCQRAGLFRHPKQCNKFYACRWDCTKQRFTLHVFNCPVQLSFDPSIGACNWPSQGPSCQGDTLLTNSL